MLWRGLSSMKSLNTYAPKIVVIVHSVMLGRLCEVLLQNRQTWRDKFYICSPVHRNSRLKKSNKMQLYVDSYLLLNYSTCFGRPSHPSSGVRKTVVAASGTDHTIWEASFFKRDQISYLVTFVCIRGCNYSFTYSRWWVWRTPETCRVI